MSISPRDPGRPAPAAAPPPQLPPAERRPVTLRTLRSMAARNEPFACLTAYDATTARWLERGGVHVLLVGDSAAQVVLGFERTIDMPLEVALVLTAAVKRGAPRTLVMADMPFASYQASDEQAVLNGSRFMTEGLADVVKIEADASFARTVAAMTRAGIPVCAHVGCRPQGVAVAGGYSAAGRTAADAHQVVRDAVALEQAGAVLLLVEAVPEEVTRAIVSSTSVPLIGIGAGAGCHGQVLVIQDLLGMTDSPPRFAEPVAEMGPGMRDAAAEWVRRVRTGEIGGQRYVMREGEAARFGIQEGHDSESTGSAPRSGPMGSSEERRTTE
ncbi:MAG TPA: 3-methyl-2-oxobutanoate hydroxymethyltransferase [Phycisphaerales bacterium]|nr:3-methyl-2-oxobutanoate hydroxymethyltransferase [Phycisphaerales bacterium]